MRGEDRFADLSDGTRICYRVQGPPEGVPVLLIAGLGLDLTSWPGRMVDGLLDRGARVVAFDNRDAGRSTRVPTPSPSPLHSVLGRPRPDSYDLGAMAADTVGLLDHLGIERAHLVGMSMGGMIGQTLAARHPDRAASLTSVFSTTGERRVGRVAWSSLARMGGRPARTVEESVRKHLAFLRHIGSAVFPPDIDEEVAWARGLWERAGGVRARSGVPRQIGAIHASGDRTRELARIGAPTLVVHGDVDLMVHPSGGRATARAVPGARFVEIAGMAHHLAPGVVDRLVDLVGDHTARAGG
ncbi:alpha/beta fold hydrolase [Nocardiopsis sp. NPDC057823]|uniref:alpha/beta fold hydrolase n=1 Tax=Nocardiopsis sp. NPDC057823 TaxID=3346256 RepID=UPI00367059FD